MKMAMGGRLELTSAHVRWVSGGFSLSSRAGASSYAAISHELAHIGGRPGPCAPGSAALPAGRQAGTAAEPGRRAEPPAGGQARPPGRGEGERQGEAGSAEPRGCWALARAGQVGAETRHGRLMARIEMYGVYIGHRLQARIGSELGPGAPLNPELRKAPTWWS